MTASGNPSVENSTGHTSQDQNKIVSVSGLSGTSGSNSTSTDSERTYRVDSQDSQISDTETSGDRHWPRQNSVSESNFIYSLKAIAFLVHLTSCLSESGTYRSTNSNLETLLVREGLVPFTGAFGMAMWLLDF